MNEPNKPSILRRLAAALGLLPGSDDAKRARAYPPGMRNYGTQHANTAAVRAARRAKKEARRRNR